jgi:uncharacterized membrane protein
MSTEQPITSPPPKRRFSWTSVLLIVSLALNVFVLGAGAARFFFPPPPERYVGATYAQLVPRRFLGDLDRERRRELLKVLRKYTTDFRDSRKAAQQISEDLALALEAEPYDQLKVAAAIQAYADTGIQLVSHGQQATLDFVSQLSPAERKMMAVRLRERGHAHHRR